MHPEAPSSGTLPPGGLPPIKPPSGKFIAQLSLSSTGHSDEDTNAISRTKKDLEASRMYANFLAASLGGFSLPAGVPLLKEMALSETGQEAKVLALQRRQAVWSLANLGMSLKRFEKLPPAEQDAALETLQREATGSGERG